MIKEALDDLGHGGYKTAAASVGTTKDVLYNLATGRTSPERHRELIEDLRKFLNKPSGWPFESNVGPPGIPVSEGYAEMPYAGLISAGSKLNWSDPYESTDFRPVPSHMSAKGRFCCMVDGDSMMPLLWGGDLAIFHKSVQPKLGSIVLYRHDDMTATIKQLKHDGRQFWLHALNPSYEDVTASGIALGYLVGYVREVGRRVVTDYDPDGIFPRDF